MAAGYGGYRLLKAKIGDETCAQKLAVALGTAATAMAGGATATSGWAAPGLALAAAGVLTVVTTGITNACPDTPRASTGSAMPLLFVATAGASMTTMVFVPSLRMTDSGKLAHRELSLLAEAATIELFKGTTERLLPRANRDGLSFERKLTLAMTGLLPYMAASLAFNGLLGNLLRAEMSSERLNDLLIPMLVGALANVVKGAVNAALLRCSRDDPLAVQHAAGATCPALPDLCAKTALRFVIAHGRDILYLSLVQHGIDELGAACIAYSLYAFFAQHRELLFDMMQGDGWTEPQVVLRNAPASA